MVQCENCSEWVEDLILISWPKYLPDELPGDAIGEEPYHVCIDCLVHLQNLEIDRDNPPEIGSEAAQRD